MITFTASGYIDVHKDGAVVSRHRVEREAIEFCSKQGPGLYVLTYPTVNVVVTAPIPIPPVAGVINGTVTL